MSLKDETIQSMKLEISELQEKLKNMPYHKDFKGCVIIKYVTCGKPMCCCRRGVLHGPYAYLQFYDENKQLRQTYLKKKVCDTYIKMAEANKNYKNANRELNKLRRELNTLQKGGQEG